MVSPSVAVGSDVESTRAQETGRLAGIGWCDPSVTPPGDARRLPGE
jgi:hypothetical protein